jgi:cyclic pyranopterin phosphate synthase
MAFNHFDDKGHAVMVDISAKQPTMRTAIARSVVRMQPATLASIIDGSISKGDVIAVARLAGISAAKKTPDLIPLSHPLALHAVSIDFVWDVVAGTIQVESTVKAFERTGVEMEAIVAASVAALTIYDMCKGMEKGMVIAETSLLYKEGGKSGLYDRRNNP